MKIEEFIEARLSKLEATIRWNQVNMNGIDVGGELRADAAATRKLLEIAAKLEAHDPEDTLGAARSIRTAIALRWGHHKDFDPAWRE